MLNNDDEIIRIEVKEITSSIIEDAGSLALDTEQVVVVETPKSDEQA